MSEQSPMLLLGPTSMAGYNMTLAFSDAVIPLCNAHNRAPATRHWGRISLDSCDDISRHLENLQPEVVLYFDAVCDVAKCEDNPSWAHAMNVTNLENLISCLCPNTRLVYVSSDHVFGGDGRYTESSVPTPISAYGSTRVAAEQRVLSRDNTLLIRAGLAIGKSIDGRSGHFDWLRYRFKKGLPVTIIHDEYRSAVWAQDLARRILDLANSSYTGIRHIPSTRCLSRAELAERVASIQGIPVTYELKSRNDLSLPHLGRVEIETNFQDELASPLPSPMDYVPEELKHYKLAASLI